MSFARLTLMPEPNFRFFKIYISMSRLYRLALETSPRWLYFLNTRTHAHTHTHTLTHTHSRTDTLSHARTHTHTRLVVALCERGEKRWKFPSLHNESEFLVIRNNHQTRHYMDGDRQLHVPAALLPLGELQVLISTTSLASNKKSEDVR